MIRRSIKYAMEEKIKDEIKDEIRTEEIKEKIKKVIEICHQEIEKKPKEILSIFNDFFSEDNVDMTSNISFDCVAEIIKNCLVQFNGNSSSKYDLGNKNITLTQFLETHPEFDIEDSKDLSICTRLKRQYSYTILVHFPEVTITNEENKSIDITHLFAKVVIDGRGLLMNNFKLNRSEYPITHLISNYMHSHISYIPFNDPREFQRPCLGNGPIYNTSRTLKYESILEIWQLFCVELNNYVHTESISGVPYHYLSSVGNKSGTKLATRFDYSVTQSIHISNFAERFKDFTKEFTDYLIESKVLKFSYKDNQYTIGMSLSNFLITVSSCFLKWVDINRKKNSKNSLYDLSFLERQTFLYRAVIINNELYRLREDNINVDHWYQFAGKPVCTFKGKVITTMVINDIKEEDKNFVYIINPKISFYLLKLILDTLNYSYGRNTTKENILYFR